MAVLEAAVPRCSSCDSSHCSDTIWGGQPSSAARRGGLTTALGTIPHRLQMLATSTAKARCLHLLSDLFTMQIWRLLRHATVMWTMNTEIYRV